MKIPNTPFVLCCQKSGLKKAKFHIGAAIVELIIKGGNENENDY